MDYTKPPMDVWVLLQEYWLKWKFHYQFENNFYNDIGFRDHLPQPAPRFVLQIT